jgi:hypothetical protein
MNKKDIAKKMGKKGNRQEFGPQDGFTAKDAKKEKRAYTSSNGPEPKASWLT